MRNLCLFALAALGVACTDRASPIGDRDPSTVDTADLTAEGWPEGWAAFEHEVVHLVNVQRAAPQVCGGDPQSAGRALTLSPSLREASRGHSRDMASVDTLSHELFGEGPGARALEAGYPSPNVAENIAVGQTTPTEVVQAWMRSPGHCVNIMGIGHMAIGVGLFVDVAGVPWWTQLFGSVE